MEYSSPKELDRKRRSLRSRREELNDFVAEMATETGPYQEPFYELLWKIVALCGYRGPALHLNLIDLAAHDASVCRRGRTEPNAG